MLYEHSHNPYQPHDFGIKLDLIIDSSIVNYAKIFFVQTAAPAIPMITSIIAAGTVSPVFGDVAALDTLSSTIAIGDKSGVETVIAPSATL